MGDQRKFRMLGDQAIKGKKIKNFTYKQVVIHTQNKGNVYEKG